MEKQEGPSWLTPAWAQKGLTALREAVDVPPDLKRAMVEFLIDNRLWRAPDGGMMSYETGINRFNANLNPQREGVFRTTELWALARHFDRPQLFQAAIEDLGFETRRVATEERKFALLERLVVAMERAGTDAEYARGMLLALGGEAWAARVHPAIREGRAAFDMPAADGAETSPLVLF